MTPRAQPWHSVGTAGLLCLALLTAGPLLLESRPAAFIEPYPSACQTRAAEVIVLLVMSLVLAVRAALDRGEPRRFGLAVLFAGAAAAMTAVHWLVVDS